MPNFHGVELTSTEQASYLSKVLVPLFVAVVDTGAIVATEKGNTPKSEDHKSNFFELLEVHKQTCSYIQDSFGISDIFSSVELMGSIATIVSSHYRAIGRSSEPKEYMWILEQFSSLSVIYYTQDVNKGFVQIASQYGTAVAAICRFAFGLKEEELLGIVKNRLEVYIDRLLKEFSLNKKEDRESIEVFRTALATLYAESHYAEMDRLLDMPPEDRADYVEKHGNKPPMDNVWSALELRVSLLMKITKEFYESES